MIISRDHVLGAKICEREGCRPVGGRDKRRIASAYRVRMSRKLWKTRSGKKCRRPEDMAFPQRLAVIGSERERQAGTRLQTEWITCKSPAAICA